MGVDDFRKHEIFTHIYTLKQTVSEFGGPKKSQMNLI